MRITTRFGVGIGLLLSLIVIVAVTGCLCIQMVRNAERAIVISTDIERLALEMDRGMEKARRLHGDFFVQYPQIGLLKAHDRYAQPSERQIARVLSLCKKLKGLIAGSHVSEALRKNHVDVNLYLSSAQRFAETSIACVELATQLASPKKGLETLFENHFYKLHEIVRADPAIEQIFDEMKSFAKDYTIARKRFLMQSSLNIAFKLRNRISSFRDFGKDKKEEAIRLLDRIQSTAEKILRVDMAIKLKRNDLALQAESVASVSTPLITLAKESVAQGRKKINRAQKMAISIMLATTLAGLILAGVIAGILNKSITRRVVGLAQSANELKKGNLDVFVNEDGTDEMSRLAATLNIMAFRIRELIDNLEQKTKQRTAELVESEKRFHQLFEHSSSGVVVYSPVDDGNDFIIRDANKSVETIEKVKRRDIIGKRATQVFPGIEEFGLLDVLKSVSRSGLSVRHPVSFYADDRLEGWRENSVYKLPAGEIVAVYDDLTEQKQAEIDKRTMESKLQRAQKMEAIGLLAGGVAHDLNNILSGIVSYPELLLMQLDKNSELIEPIKAIHESGLRAVAVVSDLLTVARGVAGAKTTADLNRLITEYMASPEYLKLKSTHEHIHCVTQLDPDPYPINCSPVHIKKCIMNLVTNAMEAIDGAGRIKISTTLAIVDDKMAWVNNIEPGEYALLSVADNGNGIPDNDLEHIFEPFYTKKVMGISGTGLGLAVVWNSVVDHKGTVLVESSGMGTVFNLYFPSSRDLVIPQKETVKIEDIRGNNEKILVVDDEPHQLDIAKRMLKILNYDVTCVSSGEKAVDHLKRQRADLVLLDMIMSPGINGRETFERIITRHPDQKAIIVSGFSKSEDVKRAHQLGAKGFLKKPYAIQQLGAMVRKELEG